MDAAKALAAIVPNLTVEQQPSQQTMTVTRGLRQVKPENSDFDGEQ